VVQRRVKELGQQIGMGGIDIDHIKARVPCAQRCCPVPVAQVADVLPVHALALPGAGFGQNAFRPKTCRTRQDVGAAPAAMPKLDPRKGTVRMHRIRHRRHVGGVPVIPQAGIGGGGVVRCGVDRTVLTVDHAPAALGLDAPHRGQTGGVLVAHAGAMRHLPKAVGGGDRADLQGLEQRVETGIAHGNLWVA